MESLERRTLTLEKERTLKSGDLKWKRNRDLTLMALPALILLVLVQLRSDGRYYISFQKLPSGSRGFWKRLGGLE
jgi:ABC-type polysaccharide transport system permease subunit